MNFHGLHRSAAEPMQDQEGSRIKRLAQKTASGIDKLSLWVVRDEPVAGKEPAAPSNMPSIGKESKPGSAAPVTKQSEGLAGHVKRLKATRSTLPAAGHLVWTLRLWVNRIGVSGVAGLGLCVFAVMFYLSAVLAIQAEQTQLLEDLELSQSQTPRDGASATAVPRTPSEQLSDFYATFPTVKEVPETLRKINQLAEKQHLVLRIGDYHVTDDHTGRLVRYEVTYPIAGPYPSVRQFLRSVLAEVPSASLDKVDVQKNMADGAPAKTTVSFTLFSRREG
jgi:hypothetical protein